MPKISGWRVAEHRRSQIHLPTTRVAASLSDFMKFWSQFFIPTLKESPADAEIASHKLLIRAGLVRKLGGGLYTYMPLGLRVMQKISRICREELDAANAIELWMPHVHPVENWEQGPRWPAAREIMFRADSAGAGKGRSREPEFVLGPTHEEVITPLVKQEITSYRDLPKNFYQIGTKFRNEIRPRYGLMRAREFVMMDAYSFDVNDEASVKSYFAMKAAYEAFFKRIGVTAIAVEADTGVMGGSFSHEFMVPAEIGDDDVIYNEESGYAANREKATSAFVPADLVGAVSVGAIEEFATPGATTIAALEAAPYSVPADKQFKTLVFVGDDKPFIVILRGNDELEEAKLGSLGFTLFRAATPDEVFAVMGAKPGSLGAVKGYLPFNRELANAIISTESKAQMNIATTKIEGIFGDHAIRLIGNGVTGANKDGFHLRNVNVTRDLAITKFGDFRRVRVGEPDPKGGRPLSVKRGIEVGHIFKLGTKYSEKFGAVYTDDQKQSHPMVMGCYGIGISRTMQAVIEQSHDADGIIWPWNVAPFQLIIVVLDPSLPETANLAKQLGAVAEKAGADVLIDDREERPGIKFKDADLIGIPMRIVIGSKGLKDGVIEVKVRGQKDVQKVPVIEAEARITALVREAAAAAG